ncbi:DUF1707 domain-containing protein [Pseudonocardia sp.]|uniref:DUF1707 SHOCT-like domain-containing protein n=1 Tax=Pseudonocardia sp. TaxID=60912 RepID=UPI002606F73C|nr:DUF1707 domain-containing protein [Pseudonocardia sp.]
MSGDIEHRGGHGYMRASDADRNAVAQRLQAAVDEGRLDLSDYDERLQHAYAARTYAELERVTADLPAPVPDRKVVAKEKAAVERAQWWDEWRSWLGGAIIMIGIWGATSLASGQFNAFWPAIPLGIWAAVLLASAVGGTSRRPD